MKDLKSSFFTLSKLTKFFIIAAVLTMAGCDEDNPFIVDFSLVPEPFDTSNTTLVTTTSGLGYHVIREGSGPFVVTRRDNIRVFFTGRLTNGEIFDSSYRNRSTTPSLFSNLGALIPGFREGLIGMKEGEQRVLIIPPSLAYGNITERANPNFRFRNDTLVFDVELDEILN